MVKTLHCKIRILLAKVILFKREVTVQIEFLFLLKHKMLSLSAALLS